MKKIKEIMVISTLISIMLTMFASAYNVVVYSEEQIREQAQNFVENQYNEINNNNYPIFPRYDHRKVLVGFDKTQENIIYAGYLLQCTTVEIGQYETSVSHTITYDNSRVLNWSFSGSAEADINLFNVIKPTVSASIARSTATENAVGASVTRTFETQGIYEINIYAHATNVLGRLIYDYYDYEDVYMGRYTETEVTTSLFPREMYTKNDGIHFAAAVKVG